MTREQLRSLLLAGKASGEELHEAFGSMSEEDQQKVRERINEMVKKGLVEYGEGNIS